MIVREESAETYHANGAIGSTTLKLAMKSIRLFRDRIMGLEVDEDKPCFQVGRLAHLMVLEPAKFESLVTCEGPINPRTALPYGRDTQAFAKWQLENPHLTVVEPWLHTALLRMPKEVHKIFSGGEAEVSVYARIGNIDAKCRTDYLHGTVITDLKSIDDVDMCDREIDKRLYWLSHSYYRKVMLAETGKDHTFRFVFMEKKPPYRWRIRWLDEDYINHADAKVDELVEQIGQCQKFNDWTDYSDIEATTPLPRHYANEAFAVSADGGISL
jgi:hypothetical protein